MQLRLEPPSRRQWVAGGAIVACAALGFALRGLLSQVAGLMLGAGLLSFVSAPLARLYEGKLPRPAAALAALVSIGAATVGLLWLLLPPVCLQLTGLVRTLPDSVARLSAWASDLRRWAQARLPALTLPEFDATALLGSLSGLAGGTVNMAVNLADWIGRVSMMVVLAFFFLCDRERLLLRLELLLPQAGRPTAVRMGNAVCRELRLYLGGQLLVAGAVSLLAVAALSIVGVGNALALGLIIGLLNMIPYFGPFIGGVPAVFIALGDGWQRAALTVLALAVVQQLDGSWISPRIMGSLTGFSPAAVLVGIYAGAQLWGVAGMLFALPVMMIVRTVFRIFVQKYENI
ncbi:MAG: AI-2E family transporter [Clostridia bacterium]|nr:AI-2E family transporter [Clostridia bacterium]